MTSTLGSACLTALLTVLGVSACTDSTAPERSPTAEVAPARAVARTLADTVVFAAIEAAGGWALDTATVSFRFRGADYGVDLRGGTYVYTRAYRDSLGRSVDDVLTNTGFRRSIDGRAGRILVGAPRDSLARLDAAAREGLNAVVYFALLPRWLADGAARRHYEGTDTLRGRAYHRIRVTFVAEGGGVDHGDEFLCWFDTGDLSLDYLAYAYATDGGGLRFREAYNPRRVAGIVVQDYRNYSPPPEARLSLDGLAGAWERGNLELLSTVILEDVRVRRETAAPPGG